MAYIATVYTHRDDGASIVYVDNYSTGGNYVFTGSNSAGYKTEALEGDSIFTAIVPSGYKFKQWVYRLGSLEGSQQHNTSNPFTYRPAMDVYIWAEIEVDDSGGGGDGGGTGSWTLTTGAAMTDISTMQTREGVLEPMELYRIAIKPKNSGTLTAYTEDGTDTVGYLSGSTAWNASTGKPTNILAENDDAENGVYDFKLTYEVVAGQTYYLWVCLHEEEPGEDDFTIVVIPPGAQAGTEGVKGYVYDATQGWVECTPLVYADGKWNECSVFIASDST